MEIPKPESPYMILEILSRDKNQCRGIHVLNMGLKNAIKLVAFLFILIRKTGFFRVEDMIPSLESLIFQFPDAMLS